MQFRLGQKGDNDVLASSQFGRRRIPPRHTMSLPGPVYCFGHSEAQGFPQAKVPEQ